MRKNSAIVKADQNVPAPVAPVRCTSRSVDFYCQAPAAAKVSLVGDFNGWSPTAHPLARLASGGWTVSLKLPRGSYQYAFVVDGQPGLIQTFRTRQTAGAGAGERIPAGLNSNFNK